MTRAMTSDAAVTALAEAMASVFPDAYGTAYRHWAEVALQAISADPAILAHLGIGRLPGYRDVIASIVDVVGLEQAIEAAQALIDDGYAIEDPDADKQEDDVSTQIDTDSAADYLDILRATDPIQMSIVANRVEQVIDPMKRPSKQIIQYIVKATILDLRDHPEHGPWPVVRTVRNVDGDNLIPILMIEEATLLVPDPPEPERLQTVEDRVIALVEEYDEKTTWYGPDLVKDIREIFAAAAGGQNAATGEADGDGSR